MTREKKLRLKFRISSQWSHPRVDDGDIRDEEAMIMKLKFITQYMSHSLDRTIYMYVQCVITNKHAPVILVIVVFVIEAGHRGSTTSTSVQLTSYLFIWNFHIFDAL